MKIGKSFYYHKLGWEFADYLDWRPQLRGNSKKKKSKWISRNAKNMMKKLLRNLEEEN